MVVDHLTQRARGGARDLDVLSHPVEAHLPARARIAVPLGPQELRLEALAEPLVQRAQASLARGSPGASRWSGRFWHLVGRGRGALLETFHLRAGPEQDLDPREQLLWIVGLPEEVIGRCGAPPPER